MEVSQKPQSVNLPGLIYRFFTILLVFSFFLAPVGAPAKAEAEKVASAPDLMPPHPNLEEKIDSGEIVLPEYMRDPQLAQEMGIDGAGQTPSHINGTINALAVAIDFSDNVKTVTATYFDSLIFAAPVAGRGSVRDYYSEVSYGQVDIVTVNLPSSLGWIRAPQTYAYYTAGNNCFGSYPNNCQKLAEDIVDAVNSVVNFATYDNNGDGTMEPIMLIHAGPGAEFTGSGNDIWSHSWSMMNPRFLDGVTIADYVIMPEYWMSVSAATSDMTIGVFAHEMGHGFWELPDLYDRDSSSEGIGSWSLMAGGSWNGPNSGGWGSDGSSPAWPDAWTRIEMGFASSTNVIADGTFNIPQAYNNPAPATTILRIKTPQLATNEFFLIENRQQAANSYDQYLPGAGMFIWHVDEAMDTYSLQNDFECTANPDCNCSDGQHFLVQLEQADGAQELEYGTDRGDTGDPFPGATNNRTFSSATQPETSSWYTCSATSFSVTNISNSGATMSADIDIPGDFVPSEYIFLPFIYHFPNNAPYTPSNPSPTNGATGQTTTVDLSWTGGDPDGHTVTYDVYFETGDATPDVLKCNDAAITFCDPGTLLNNTLYYWQVIATDMYGVAKTGPVWSFTVGGGSAPTICNGTFESGHTCWTEYSSHGWDTIYNGPWPGTVTPHGGTWASWLGGEYDDTSYIQQQISVSASSPYLGFWYWIASADVCGFDYGYIKINGTSIEYINLCSDSSTGGWLHHVINLSAYAGQTITLRFEVVTDGSLNSNMFIDDVAWQTTPSAIETERTDFNTDNALPHER